MTARLRKSIEDRDKGFTLIELLVVIILIGVLAAIAIPIFLNQRKKGVDASLESDSKTLATQLETYYTDNLAYPGAVAQAGQTLTVGTEKVVLSTGNSATIKLNNLVAASATAFCLELSNPKATSAVIYDSLAGGIQAALQACPVAYVKTIL